MGELVELAQAENMMNHIGELFVDASRTGAVHGGDGQPPSLAGAPGRLPVPAGGRRRAPPRRRCRSRPLVGHLGGRRRRVGRPGRAHRPGDLAALDADQRRADHDVLDEAIAAWTSGLAASDAFRRCQERGVTAGAVHTEADCYADPHLAARGFFRRNGNAELGEHPYAGHCWRWTGPDARVGAAAAHGCRQRGRLPGPPGPRRRRLAGARRRRPHLPGLPRPRRHVALTLPLVARARAPEGTMGA